MRRARAAREGTLGETSERSRGAIRSAVRRRRGCRGALWQAQGVARCRLARIGRGGADVHDRATRGARVRRLDAQPPRVRAHPTHVHLPRGGYLVAWAGGVNARAGRGVEVWASQRAPMSREGWSTPRVVARAPGAPASHSAPSLFYVGDLLHLRFLADGAPPRRHLRGPRPHVDPAQPASSSNRRGQPGACGANAVVTRRVGGARVVLCGVVGDDGDARVDVSLDDGVTFARGAALVRLERPAAFAPSRPRCGARRRRPAGRPRRLRARRRVRR